MTQTVGYSIRCDEESEAFYGGIDKDAGVSRNRLPSVVRLQKDRIFVASYTMARQTSGYYDTTTTTATVRQSVRGGTLLRTWDAIELSYDEPDDTTLEARLHDGTIAYYWTGAAWAVAGANWNTPAVVQTNFATFAPATATSLTVEWRLQTTTKFVTPTVYGADIAASLFFAARTGSTESRSDGWTDDLIHRELIPRMMLVRPEVTDEGIIAADTSTLDYSAGVGEWAKIPHEVESVYNLDSDPTMLTPLAGAWSSITKIYTLTAPLTAGTRYAARLTYEPEVAYTGGIDLFTATLPQVIIERIVTVRSREHVNRELVRDVTSETAVQLPAMTTTISDISMLVQGHDHVSAFDVFESLRRSGVLRGSWVSTGTGMPIAAYQQGEMRPSRTGVNAAAAARFVLRVWTRQYHGDSDNVAIVDADGITITVGDDRQRRVLTGPELDYAGS